MNEMNDSKQWISDVKQQAMAYMTLRDGEGKYTHMFSHFQLFGSSAH